jgi:cytochrome c-type biogenesis protein
MNESVSVLTAFVAGIVSFLSPCVLPLVPGYISMLSGLGVEELERGERPQLRLLASAVAFVLGFSLVFVGFGASATTVGQFLTRNRGALVPVAGAVIVLFGLHLLGWLGKISLRAGFGVGVVLAVLGGILAWQGRSLPGRLGLVHLEALAGVFLLGPWLSRWLNRDVHLNAQTARPGLLSGFLMGFAFAFGWTPCIGPILAAVLALAATQETVARGVALLAVYSAGLAVPFLLTALGVGRFLTFYRRFRRYLHAVEIFSGALLLAVGALVYFNQLTWLSGKLSFLNAFSW